MDFDHLHSEALTRNMDLTNIKVEIPVSFEVLEEAVKGYAGKEKQARELLLEYHHAYRNWHYVVQETQRYAVGNLRVYRNTPLSGNVIFLLSRVLLNALRESERFEIRSLAADHLLSYWIKLAEEMPEDLAKPVPEGVTPENLDTCFDKDASCHQGILRYFFRELGELPEAPFEFLMRSFYPPKRLASKLLSIWPDDDSFGELRGFLQRFYRATYEFWLKREDPCAWLTEQGAGECCSESEWYQECAPLNHDHFRSRMHILETRVIPEPDNRKAVEKLIEMVDFHDVSQIYFQLPDKLALYQERSPEAAHIGMLMRFKVMEVKGLEAIQEETLREINFEIGRWISQEPRHLLEALLDRIFGVLEISLQNYPQAALQVIRTIGLEILETDERGLINYFIRRIIHLGFQPPKLGRVSSHWQIPVNPAHLPNVRIWLEIIKMNPHRTRTLLSALIVNLSLGGIFIRDTDLFQKDVSQLLNAPIGPVYNLVKQLAKLFPIYFNEIGAEGQLRAVSTDVDEITGRSDKLIHFLRKQSHVESNNVVVTFMQAIMEYWRTMDKKLLEGLIPAEIFGEIPESGPLVENIHKIFDALFRSTEINHVQDLLDLSEENARQLISEVPDVPDAERRRAFLMIQFYQLLHEKYALSFKDIDIHLQRAAALGLPETGTLLEALRKTEVHEKLEAILNYLIRLRDVILTPGELHIMENIYYKRHIAVDIPSMYGSYNEPRFDALGLTFRLENLANLLFEEIIYSFNLSFITRATFLRIAQFIPLFIKALEIDGIASNRLAVQHELFMKALEVPRFSHSQYMDIFRGFSEAIKQIIQTHYDSVHDETLELVIRQLGPDMLIQRYQREGETGTDRTQRVSESFLRDLIARTFGLQYFDHFITSILTTLATQREGLSTADLDLLLSYDPERTVSYIYDPNPATYDLIYMGNKAHILAHLYANGINVPPAFVITTEYFRCHSVVDNFPQAWADFDDRVMTLVHRVEASTGRKFGHPGNALLFSVRSGSAVSMPGMMNTFLNVGINEKIVEGLIAQTGEAWFAWDNYRRFIQSWAMSFGMPRDEFDAIMNIHKRKFHRTVKREFTPSEMRELALAYRNALIANKIEFSDSPKEQLFTAIQQVVKSWEEQKAKTYREIMMLSDNWGTAVTIQSMVFGNLDTHSGAGVMFTHDPWTSEDKVDPIGDFTWGNQGEDVVGGLVKTLPLSEKQRLKEGERKETSLEVLFPRVYRKLTDIAKKLVYERNWAPQEIEFTFQGASEEGVFVLQARNMTPRVKRSYPVFRQTDDLHTRYLGSGIGVSGGAISGLVAFDLETIQALKQHHPDKFIILIRSDTVPDDIREISIADAILTGKGGATSHAAIVAHRLGKTCVVGVSRMKVWEREKKCVIDEHPLTTGDTISIDGRSGAIYTGLLETEQLDLSAE